LQFCAFFLFARVLGSEGQGLLSIFRSLGQIIASIIWIGIPSSVVYFLGRDKNNLEPFLRNCLKWILAIFPFVLLTILFSSLGGMGKYASLKPYVKYLPFFILFASLFDLFQGVMLGLKKYLYYNLFTFCSGLLILLGALIVGFIDLDSYVVKFSILVYIISFAIMSFVGGVVTFSAIRIRDRIKSNLSFITQLAVGIRGFISSMASLLLFRLDLIIVSYFLSFKEAGIYSIAIFSAEMITKIPYWSAAVLTPIVASNEEGNVKKTIYLFYSSIILALILATAFILIIKLLPDIMSNLIGKEFSGVEICMLLLLPRVIMQSGIGILAANLAGKGYPWYHPLGTLLAVLLLIILDILLIPIFGVRGASMANSLAYIGAVIVFWLGFVKYNKPSKMYIHEYCNYIYSHFTRLRLI
jgi:O-antigen/teichoic acid export membrane protein